MSPSNSSPVSLSTTTDHLFLFILVLATNATRLPSRLKPGTPTSSKFPHSRPSTMTVHGLVICLVLAVNATCPLSGLKIGRPTLSYFRLSRPSTTTTQLMVLRAVKAKCLLSGLKVRDPLPISPYPALACPSTTTLLEFQPRFHTTDVVRVPSGLYTGPDL